MTLSKVGRFDPAKRWLMAMDAAAQLKAEGFRVVFPMRGGIEPHGAEVLAQSDNLHLIQWVGRHGSEAEVSAYFTPQEWWSLGPERIVWEIQQVYKNFRRHGCLPASIWR